MGRPRIFISSTYFDLRVVRSDLERFIREIGYEPVLSERGHIAYGKEAPLENYCYKEITHCDIIISVVGGKFGTQSQNHLQSISQKELRTAIDHGKQIYIFVEKPVLAEYRTYIKNKNVKDFTPTSVDSLRIFQFLEELYSLPAGNPIEAFETSNDIVRYLKEQWAGLFQRLLQESARQMEIELIEDMKNTASTLNQLVTFLTEERRKGDNAIKDILLSSHPAFEEIKKAAKIPYRVVFHSIEELDALLGARGYEQDEFSNDDTIEWDNQKACRGIRVCRSIFDENGRLKVLTPEEWTKENVEVYELQRKGEGPEDEEPPF
jgi:hypothetical protein